MEITISVLFVTTPTGHWTRTLARADTCQQTSEATTKDWEWLCRRMGRLLWVVILRPGQPSYLHWRDTILTVRSTRRLGAPGRLGHRLRPDRITTLPKL